MISGSLNFVDTFVPQPDLGNKRITDVMRFLDNFTNIAHNGATITLRR